MFKGDFAADDVRAYGELVEHLHAVQNALASMPMDREAIDGLAADLAGWRERLERLTTDEQHQVNGRVAELPVRGHAMLPELVVTGSHGRRGLRRFVLGSVAETTVRHAPCSVLVARATADRA